MTECSSRLIVASLLLFAAFSAVAVVDGAYYHLRRFRLWAHPETRAEHAAHAARALLFPPTLVLLFLVRGRVALVAGAALVALDLVAGGVDVALERTSRNRFGGLPHGEYVIHLAATVLHVAAEVLVLVGRLGADDGASPGGWATAIVWALVAGSSLGAVQHVALAFRGWMLGGARLEGSLGSPP